MKRFVVVLLLLAALPAHAQDKEVTIWASGMMDQAAKAETVTASGIQDSDLATLVSFKKAKEVTLEGCDEVTDDGLGQLAKLSSLRTLTIKSCKKITDEGVLAAAKNVRELALEKVHVTDDLVRRLPAAGPLRSLSLEETDTTDATIGELVKAKKLTSIRLVGDAYTDKGFASLGELTTLTRIDVSGKQIGDDGWKAIMKLPNLTSLRGTPSTLEPLRDKTTITTLSLWSQGAALEPLSTLKNLESLELGSGSFTDDDVKHLAGLAKLRSLRLSFAKLRKAGIEALANLPALKELSLWECCADRSVSFASLANKSLDRLVLRDKAIDDDRLAEIASFTKITDLEISIPTRVTRNGFVALKRLKQAKRIWLDIEKGSELTTSDVDGLEKALPKCRVGSSLPRELKRLSPIGPR